MSRHNNKQRRSENFMLAVAREPFTHFLLIGAVLFILYSFVGNRLSADVDKRIDISPGRVQQLANTFEATNQRAPARSELQILVDDFVLEEIYYREAIALGLDRDDTVIRRRLRQKLEFIGDDLAAGRIAADDVLETYLASNPETFRQDTLYSMRQFVVDADRPGIDREDQIEKFFTILRTGEALTGQSGMLPTQMTNVPAREIDKTFGAGFAARLDVLPLGEWQGPIESVYGLHLVRLDARLAGVLPDLEDIRADVERAWFEQNRREARHRLNERLLNEYEVFVEWPGE